MSRILDYEQVLEKLDFISNVGPIKVEQDLATTKFNLPIKYYTAGNGSLDIVISGATHGQEIITTDFVLKLMEGYNEFCALRIDLYPVDLTRSVIQSIPYSETRKRIAQRNQGRDDNSENMIKAWDNYIKELNKYPQFQANIIAFADHLDIAVMLADSVGSEAVESGSDILLVHTMVMISY